jgi:hypothetical protein
MLIYQHLMFAQGGKKAIEDGSTIVISVDDVLVVEAIGVDLETSAGGLVGPVYVAGSHCTVLHCIALHCIVWRFV